ncbi:hypothetical protein HN011_009509 [Eciton burchellii]|nr:hypothetical protein HN011_009509 [Eciton burchellii]
MTISRKCNIIFMLEALIILPIVFGARLYHNNSYQEYYGSHINNEQLKSISISKEVAEESYYKRVPLRVKKYVKLENSFVFPDEDFQTRNNINRESNAEINPVMNCSHKNQTFCEDVSNYPIEFINEAILKNSSLMHYAHKDIITILPRSDTDEEPLCLSMEQVIRPKTGININNKWLYILQSDELNFHQSIRVETCQEVNTKCKLIDGFAEGYVTTCKQKYIYRELSGISETGEVVRDYFRFPASCCCHVHFQANIE